MAKITRAYKTPEILDDWDVNWWNKETYAKHETDFQKIHQEAEEIQKQVKSRILTRYFWLQRKEALRMLNYMGKYMPYVNYLIYKRFDNMYSRYCDWLSFKEKQSTPKLSEITENTVALVAKFDIKSEKDEEFDNFVREATDNFT